MPRVYRPAFGTFGRRSYYAVRKGIRRAGLEYYDPSFARD